MTEEQRAAVRAKLSRLKVHPELVKEIKTRVCVLQQVAHEASHVALLHVITCFSAYEPLPTPNQNFFYRCCAGVLLGARPCVDRALERTLCAYRALCPHTRPQLENYSDSLKQLARRMAKNAKQHLQRNVWRRVVAHAAATHEEARSLVRRAGAPPEACDSAEVLALRSWLQHGVSKTSIASNQSHFLGLSCEMIEAAEIDGRRTWRALPITTSYIPSFIDIATTILLSLCMLVRRRTGEWIAGSVPLAWQAFLEHKCLAWSAVFALSEFETATRKHACFITTDGVAVSVALTRPRSTRDGASDHEDDDDDASDRSGYRYAFPDAVLPSGVIAIDSGVATLAAMASTRPFVVEQEHQARALGRAAKREHRKHLTRQRADKRCKGKKKRDQQRRRLKREKMRQKRKNVSHDATLRIVERRRRRGGAQRGAWRAHRGCTRHKRNHDLHAQHIRTREYRHKSRVHKQRDWHERLKYRDREYATALQATPSFETVRHGVVTCALQQYTSTLTSLLRFSAVHAFRNWRFKTSRYQQQALAVLAKRVASDQDTVVALGDWSTQSVIKGHPRSPVELFVRTLVR